MTDDLISRKATIEWINKLFCEPCKEKRDLYGGVVCRACLIDDAIGAIETAPSAQQWIPVTERLPNMDDICLVCGKNGGMYVARFWTNGNLILWTKTGTGKFVNPVAWMPLPEPYKEEE